jgi:hypothetical protein
MRRRWKALVLRIGVCLAALAFVAYLVNDLSSDEWHDKVTAIPMGSRLSDLDTHYKRPPDADPRNFSGEVTSAAYSPVRYKGDYDEWTATPEERDQFTGTIDFIHHGSTSSDLNHLEYKDGRLIKKDWGFLPG